MKLKNFRKPWMIFVLLLFSTLTFYSFYDSLEMSLTGHVVAEDGVMIRTAKLDDSLIEKLERGEKSTQIFVELNNKERVIKETGAKVKHEFASVNAITVELNDSLTLKKLAENRNVKRIYHDYEVYTTLDNSVSKIKADHFVNNLNITGEGQAVCVIDTGVDYTHPALGNCSSSSYVLEGEIEEYILESDQNYKNNEDHVWTITKEGYNNIALHFKNISLEQIGQYDTLDRIMIYNSNFELIAIYKGVMENVWTPHSVGDTMYVRLISDGSINDYGFYVNQIINGTTDTKLDWNNCNKIVNGWDFHNNNNDPLDDNSHGTHCAGIIASTDKTYQGVAPGANLVAVKALSGSGSGYASDVMMGMEWCINNAQKYNIVAISMSLGDGSSHQEHCNNNFLAPIINHAVANNIAVYVAAGNNAPLYEGISAPACIESATPVGTIDNINSIKYKRGEILELVAPGVSIRAPVLNNNYGFKSGTSMSAPHVAGASLLLREYYLKAYGQDLTPAEIETIMKTKGDIIYDSNTNRNYTLINLEKMVQPLLSYANNTAQGQVESPVLINFSSDVPLSYSTLVVNGQNLTLNKTYHWLNLDPGDYSYHVKGYDALNSSTILEIINITVIATVNETILVHSPLNNSYLNTNLILNFTLDNELNYTLSNSTNIIEQYYNNTLNQTYYQEFNLSEGNYALNITNHDKVIFFTVDKTAPVFTNIVVPQVTNLDTSVTFEVLVEDENLDKVILSTNLNGTWQNYSIEESLTFEHNFIANETIEFYYLAYDLANNSVLSDNYNFTVNDGCISVLEIVKPTNQDLELGHEIEFKANIDSSSAIIKWKIANDTYNTKQVYHTFTNIGTYNVKVNATNGPECYLESNFTVNVNDTLPPELVVFHHKKVELGSLQEILVEMEDYSEIVKLKLYYDKSYNILNSLEHSFTVIKNLDEFSVYVEDEHGNSNNLTFDFTILPVTTSASSGGGGGGSSSSTQQLPSVPNIPRPSVTSTPPTKKVEQTVTEPRKELVNEERDLEKPRSNIVGAATAILEEPEQSIFKGNFIKIMAVLVVLLTVIYIKVK